MPVTVNYGQGVDGPRGPDPYEAPPPIEPPAPPPIAPPSSHTPHVGNAQDRMLTVNAANGVTPVVYGGPLPVGGGIMFVKQVGGWLYLDFYVSQGPIEEITEVKIDGRPIAATLATYNVHLGVAGDTTDALMSEADATYTVPEFSARVSVKFPTATEITGQYDPTRFSCTVKGRTLFDTRTSTTAWSTNPVLAIYDALTNDRYGRGVDTADIDTASFNQAANDCDVDIDPGAGTVKRWEISLRIAEELDGDGILNLLRAHCGAIITPTPKWKCVLDIARASTGITLIDNGAGRNCTTPIVDSKDVSEIPTVVLVDFTDAANEYKDESVQYPDPFPADTDWREARYTLRGLTTRERARRAAVYLYNRLRLTSRISTQAWESALPLEPGDRFALNSRRFKDDGSSEDATVSEVRSGTLGHTVFSELYRSGTFSDTIDTGGGAGAPPPPQTPHDAPPNPTGLTAVETVELASTGAQTFGISVDWTNGDTPFYRGTRVSVTAPQLPRQELGEHENGPVQFKNVVQGLPYTFTLETMSHAGVPSAGTTVQFTPTFGPNHSLPPSAIVDAGGGRIYWGTPLHNTPPATYGASFWSQTGGGFLNYDATKINDGVLNVDALECPAGGTRNLILDLGAGNDLAMRAVNIWAGPGEAFATSALDLTVNTQVAFSDDAAAWTNATSLETVTPTGSERHVLFPGYTAHRYWRIAFTNQTATDFGIAEVQYFVPGSGAWPYVKHYEVWSRNEDGARVEIVVPGTARPTTNTPLDISSLLRANTSDTTISGAVYTISANGKYSAAAAFSDIAVPPVSSSAFARIQSLGGSEIHQGGIISVERGKFGPGDASPNAVVHATSENSDAPMILGRHQADSGTVALRLRKSRGTTASPAATVEGDGLASLIANAHDGGSYIDTSQIRWTSDGPVAANSVPTRMQFHTGVSAAGVERMRISSDGLVTIFDDLQVDGGILGAASNLVYTVSGGDVSFVIDSNNELVVI